MAEEKTQGQLLEEKLQYKPESAWTKIDENQKKEVFSFCEGYKTFLDHAKTEREAIIWAEKKAIENGFVSLEQYISNNKKLKSGDKVYITNREKNIILAVIGDTPLEQGINLVGSHVDAPRIDLKPNPLYEGSYLALLKTHYYGGIKKYQWTTIPLAIHGVIIKGNGEKISVKIGEEKDEPQFYISDLLPHLAQDQMEKKMKEAVTGEGLNIIIGHIPYNDEKVKDKIKVSILNLLNEKYGIIEEDFQRAELEIVPAFNARDIGFDRALIGAYGQDDRICAYTSFQAFLKSSKTSKTKLCMFVDKEEIGSMGNTGIQSSFLLNSIAELCALTYGNYSDLYLRRALNNSKVLSADVNAGVDPTYEEVNDMRNAIFMGRGVGIAKYTGSRGKGGASDANAEFIGKVINLLNENKVIWQSGELGKVDTGGGGTIAQYVANYGADVLDVGPGLLSMHAPYELSSKIDVYMTYKACLAFYNND